jgi:hypothetical protein
VISLSEFGSDLLRFLGQPQCAKPRHVRSHGYRIVKDFMHRSRVVLPRMPQSIQSGKLLGRGTFRVILAHTELTNLSRTRSAAQGAVLVRGYPRGGILTAFRHVSLYFRNRTVADPSLFARAKYNSK